MKHSLWILFACGAGFALGAAAMQFQWPVSKNISEALDGGEAWLQERRQTQALESADTLDSRTIDGSVRHWDKQRALEGYTLIAVRFSTSVFLLDMEGKIAHRWNIPFQNAWPDAPHIANPRGKRIYIRSAYLYPNGDLLALFEGFGDTPYGYGLAKVDKASRVIWTVDERAHHDVDVNEDGSIYTLTHAIIKEPAAGLEHYRYPMLADAITIISPDGKTLDKLPILEAFAGTTFEHLARYESKKPTWDAFHANSVRVLKPSLSASFPMFNPGAVIVSLMSNSTLAVIDMRSRKVVWAAQGAWLHQHSADFLPTGNFLLFDNNGASTPEAKFSRVMEINPRDLKGVRTYGGSQTQPFYTNFFGTVQPLKNGNRLIAESESGRVFEVDEKGEVVWDYSLNNNEKSDGFDALSLMKTTHRDIVMALRYEENALLFLSSTP